MRTTLTLAIALLLPATLSQASSDFTIELNSCTGVTASTNGLMKAPIESYKVSPLKVYCSRSRDLLNCNITLAPGSYKELKLKRRYVVFAESSELLKFGSSNGGDFFVVNKKYDIAVSNHRVIEKLPIPSYYQVGNNVCQGKYLNQ